MKISYLLLVVIIVSFGVEGADLRDTICKEGIYEDLCIKTLKSDPRSAKADVKGLVRIILEANLATSNHNFKQAATLLKRTWQKELRNIFQTCKDNYSNVVNRDLPNAIRSLDSNDLGKFHDYIVAADEAEGNCHDAMEGSSLIGSPLYDGSVQAEHLSVIAVEILTKGA